MCGISGLCGFDDFQGQKLDRMINSINHRGPDSSGKYLGKNVNLGMARLAIIDVVGGQQPICTEDNRYIIVFNGEIYNYKELTKSLISRGIRITSSSDTEVFLKLFVLDGISFLNSVRGMFSAAIYDSITEKLWLIRDRLGIKPLYFYTINGKMVFASEIKAIIASGHYIPELATGNVPSFFARRYVQSNRQLFKSIEELSPGSILMWQKGNIKIDQYWQYNQVLETRQGQKKSKEDLFFEFDHLFNRAVDEHLVGEVPFGAYLSAGLDSSSLVHSLAEKTSAPFETFTIGFGWNQDEIKAASIFAKSFGLPHTEIHFTSADFQDLEKITFHNDNPLGDPIYFPTFKLAQVASQKTKYVFSGEGADEIFGGYLFQKVSLYLKVYGNFMNPTLHQKLIMPLIKSIPEELLNKFFTYPGKLNKSGKDRVVDILENVHDYSHEDLIELLTQLFSLKNLSQLFHKEFLYEQHFGSFSLPQCHTRNEGLFEANFQHWLPDNILKRQDKMSMASGLEVRVPFLDHTIVEFMRDIPLRDKISLTNNKIFLREYIKRRQLKNTASLKKSAFYIPLEKFLSEPKNKDFLFDAISEEIIKKGGMFNNDKINEIKNSVHANSSDFLAAKMLFSISSFHIWKRVFGL
jgi:asparagine synthase (glutamine-hydrolysing)